ncbi:putative mediator of RNA polymerase II transcription subunit 26 [Pieris napi]|uniref:putative mediator of RNA polymerase II transcription subunit 26 n=1 Tax=Pieris napi TaxID=78633 RepID=UPI001FBAFF46|nr:putative mediator of RNA polymerase II transcription subunit 26 [Pieris napi]
MELVNRINIVLILLVIKEIIGSNEAQDLSDSIINDLYNKYMEAINRDGDLVILRRQFDQNQLFEIHVKKLKEVNGYKLHNLMIKGKVRSGSPFIYINNPVESKMPNAYLTLEEFKEALTKRVQKHKKTTLNFVDVFFTTKKPNTRLHMNSSTILNNATNVLKVTTNLIRSSFTSSLKEENASNPITSTKATAEKLLETTNILNSSTTAMKLDSPTEETSLTTVSIEDLMFLRTLPMNYTYTEIENYSNMSGTSKTYKNNTVNPINMTSIIDPQINDTKHQNASHLLKEQQKLNKDVTSVDSIPINITKLQDKEDMSNPNKTNENQIKDGVNMITDYPSTKIERNETYNLNVTILTSPEIDTTSLPSGSSIINSTSPSKIHNVTDTHMPLFNNTYKTNNITIEVLSTIYTQVYQNHSDVTITDLSEKTTESVITKLLKPEINNTENTKLDTYITVVTKAITKVINESFTFTNDTPGLTNSSNLITSTNTSTTETSKRVPKRKVTSETSTIRTPWRRRTFKRATTKSTTKTRRSTLGRPLVFMGGP